MEDYGQTKKVERIVVLCMLLLVAVVAVAIVSFVSIGKARKENGKYNELIAELRLQKESLSDDLDYMNSSVYLEEQARNHLSMIKKGETRYEFK